MIRLVRLLYLATVSLLCCVRSQAQTSISSTLAGTAPLTDQGDLSAQMVAGIDTFLMKQTEQSIAGRSTHWHRDFSSAEAYNSSVQANRERLRKIIGAVDSRVPINSIEFVSSTAGSARLAETEAYTADAVRWPVFEGVWAEGIWLRPRVPSGFRIVAIPDADQTPEMICGLAPGVSAERQFARRLAENGCEVLIPVLIDREDTWSGNAALKRFTNQPHREWIYRQAYELGRHIIGYEVQKVLAAVDWFEQESTNQISGATKASAKIGVVGYAEGGLIAFYAAALDQRIDVTVVSGYFDSRQALWQEPIYRNVFGLLEEFGDAEIATLVAPRTLIVEHSAVPKVDGPPKPRAGRSGAAPGRLITPDYESVEREVGRARELVKGFGKKGADWIELVGGNEGMATGPISDQAMEALLRLQDSKAGIKRGGKPPVPPEQPFGIEERQHRQVAQLEEFTQRLLDKAETVRGDFFWKQANGKSARPWEEQRRSFQTNLWEEVIGRFPPSTMPANPRSRPLAVAPDKTWAGYEVKLDIYPEVYAWGYLLVPKDLKPGERRPVVVCQHGLESVPADVINEDPKTQAYGYYKAFAPRLAERGFVVFAPHNPYRGQDKFRVLQRKANPLKKSLFSIIIAQHGRILDWLAQQPFVDPKRIGFYGLSYGGKTAMRVPALLDGYALSICSADFNEWIRKNTMTDFAGSYMFGGEYEMPEFNLGMTFNYAEMAALIAPRPFMVERGHDDTVGTDEWVAYEYARVRRFYDRLGIGDRTQIEFFDGPHTVNGVGTFEFLEKHLRGERK
jgi:dienelactone hydrolase